MPIVHNLSHPGDKSYSHFTTFNVYPLSWGRLGQAEQLPGPALWRSELLIQSSGYVSSQYFFFICSWIAHYITKVCFKICHIYWVFMYFLVQTFYYLCWMLKHFFGPNSNFFWLHFGIYFYCIWPTFTEGTNIIYHS